MSLQLPRNTRNSHLASQRRLRCCTSIGPEINGDTKPRDNFDVLKALKITMDAIRSVKNRVLSLPSESSVITGNQRKHYRPQHLTNLPVQKRHSPNPSSASVVLSRIREAALSTLSVLRLLEESSRLPLSDDA